jgi:hypothetical protein
MERFVFVAAVTFAIIFGVVAWLGNGHFNIDIDGDGFGVAPVVETAAGRMEAEAFAGDNLRVRYAAARITITPEDRQDFLIEIDNPGRAPMPLVSVDEGRVTVDGQLRGRVGNCREGGGAELRGYGELAVEDLPQINIRAPRTLNVSLGSGSTTGIGPSQELNLDISGCGTATIGDVAGEFEVDVAGSGDVRAGAAQSFRADIAGSGDVVVGAVANGADIDIAGSGTVTIASLTGSLSADSAGSGSVTVQGGAITVANIDLAGSGGVEIAATVQTLKVAIVGSGDVDVEGQVGDIEADIAGSGGVSASAVTGNVRKEVLGSGDVRVGD